MNIDQLRDRFPMVAGHVLYDQLKQGRILSHFGPMAGRLPTHRLENGSRH
jgi:hypothetical protein